MQSQVLDSDEHG